MNAKKSICLGIAALLLAPPARAGSDELLKIAAGLGLVAAARSAALKGKRAELKTKRGQAAVPAFGELSTATAGQPIYANFNYDAVKTAQLEDRVWEYEGGAMRKELPATVLFERPDGKFCTPSGRSCFADKDSDGDFDKAGKRRADVAYTESVVWLDASSDGFRSELVYQGAGGGVLQIAYREFVDDMARPAFTQLATFDLAEAGVTRVAYQDLVIEVLEAGNMGISYKVLPAETVPAFRQPAP